MSDIGERVKKIVVEHLGVEPEKVTEGASFIDDLGADSMDTVELVMAFEEVFGCEIPDDAGETILTVGDAVKFVEDTGKGGWRPGFDSDIPADEPRLLRTLELLKSGRRHRLPGAVGRRGVRS